MKRCGMNLVPSPYRVVPRSAGLGRAKVKNYDFVENLINSKIHLARHLPVHAAEQYFVNKKMSECTKA